MNRIAVLCGTGMSAFSTALSSSVEATSEIVNVESKWGNVPINVVRTISGEVFVIDRHHSPGEKRTPPHAIEHRANVYAASSCKPDLLVSVNSVGSMIETMPPGTIGVGSGMLDLSEKPWTFHDEDAFHSDRTNPFDNFYSDICAKTLTVKQGGAPPRVVVAQVHRTPIREPPRDRRNRETRGQCGRYDSWSRAEAGIRDGHSSRVIALFF